MQVEIDRAENATKIDGIFRGSINRMNSCQNRTCRVVQDLGSDGSEQQPPERAASFRRHQDQTAFLRAGTLDNRLGNVALQDDPPDGHTVKFRAEDGLHSLLGVFAAGGEKLS